VVKRIMNRINKHQLFSLTVIFTIGSTTLFTPGIEAKQDAWIAVLLAMVIGLGFAWIYTELQASFPEKNYIQIIISILGKPLGIPLSILYVLYWLWPAARILRESSELIVLTILPNTPLSIIIATFALTSLYVLSLGLRVLGRTAEITMPLFIFFIVIAIIMIFISGNVNLRNLTPVLNKGIIPVIKAAYPAITIFPFSFILIFLMYWCHIDNKTTIRKTTMLSILISGTLLSIILIIDVTVLGVEYASISTIPLYVIVRMIDIGEFITNLDAIGAIVIFLGGFYMMSLFLGGINMVLSTIFKQKKSNLLLFCITIFLIQFAITFEETYTYHRWMYPFDTYFLHPAFLEVIPTSLLLIHKFKNNHTKHIPS
jgi:spore germination protein KB